MVQRFYSDNIFMVMVIELFSIIYHAATLDARQAII